MIEKSVFEIARRGVQRSLEVVLPSPEVHGDPFWALMNIYKDGETTGSYYSIRQESVPIVPLYPARGLAENFLAEIGVYDLAIRGISKKHLRVLIEFQRRGKIQLGIFVPMVESPSGYGFYTPSAEHIEQMLKEFGYGLDNV